MRQYIKTEAKRLISTLPGFLLALLSILLLALLTAFLAGNFLPEVLEVTPFRVGLCIGGDDFTADYIREYTGQMESTEGLVEFLEVQRQDVETALKEGELTACIIIPERTVESIMDGTNIPVQVIMGAGVENTERYLQQRLLMMLTECGAVLIDVPQAETLLLYEMQVENPEETGRILDLFHFGLVLDRENWFEEKRISAFGSVDIRTYYLAAGVTLVLIFWGLGCGSFFREQEKNLSLLLKRRGIPFAVQQGVRQILFFMLYLIPTLVLGGGIHSMQTAGTVLLCSVMLSLQCSFFFTLVPGAASGVVLNCIWGFAAFLGAGGVLPSAFLPEVMTEVCGRLPAGVCLELLLRSAAGRGSAGGKLTGLCLLWSLFFGILGQLVFCGKQQRKMRK